MKIIRLLFICATWCTTLHAADDDGITWLINYEGKQLPDSTWTVTGKPNATVVDGALRLVDDSDDLGHFRKAWKAEPDQEIVVEVKVQTAALTPEERKRRERATSYFVWRDGSPVSVLVSDGRHQEGLTLTPSLAMSFTDRIIRMDTTDRLHTYRLVIRGTDMSIWVNGVQKVQGQGAFWKAADSPEPFIQFGSRTKAGQGESMWASVKLGVRKPAGPIASSPLKVTISEPWPIPRGDDVKERCPYLYDMGQGLLLLCVAQGADKLYGNYALHRSTDAGKTWTPIDDLDKVNITPLPMLRLADGTILGASRWTTLQADGSLTGKTTYLDARAMKFTQGESRVHLPKEFMPVNLASDVVIFERHIFHEADGSINAVCWSRRMHRLPDGQPDTVRSSHLLKTTDHGKTWNCVSTLGRGGEPAVARLSATEMTAVIRGNETTQMTQTFSHDAGKSWDTPILLEEGRVAPDLVLMSNGVLACSYGRPASCIMFSIDGGKTWCSHHVVSNRVHFNYAGIREISPGRLLYVHDAPTMNAVYIDVERLD